MKLRNKKTGKIVIVEFISDYQTDDGTEIGFRVKNTLNYYSYPSIAELNEEWEDYKSKEPLIKDEKIRKAVRVWFNANNFGCRSLQYYKDGYSRSHFVHAKGNTMKIFFREEIGNLKDGNFYDIDDLCGEEEECYL